MIERLESGLSAEMRQLIAAARGADDPSAEDEARVKARWLASIAAGAGVSSLTEAAHAAAGTGWGLKVAGVAAAVAAASAGVYLGWPATSGSPSARNLAARSVAAREISVGEAIPARVTESHAGVERAIARGSAAGEPSASSRVVSSDRAGSGDAVSGPSSSSPSGSPPTLPAGTALAPHAAEPALAESEAKRLAVAEVNHAEAAPLARAVQPTPSRAMGSSSRARMESPERAPAGEGTKLAPAEAVKAPSDVGGQLGEEINMLSRVRTSIQAGESNQALELLGEYGQRFEHPSLAMEADALRIDALCGAGQREAARERAAHFVATWPGSPLEQRVRDACP